MESEKKAAGKKPEPKGNVHVIRVSLDKKRHRDIAIRSHQTLENLAEAIVDSWDFDLDHAYGFFGNLENPYDSEERYELFADLGEDFDSDSGSVRKTRIENVFLQGKKMLFLFDYGDEWLFLAECTEVKPSTSGGRLPVIVARTGDSPEQYPDTEDDEEAA